MIERYGDGEGFGFTRPEDGGKDVSVHHPSTPVDGRRSLRKGDRVEL